MSRRARLVCALLALLAVAAWSVVGLTRLHVDSDLDSLLPSGDPAVTQLDSMAQTFGGDPIVVLIEGGGDPLSSTRLANLLKLEGQLSSIDGVVATYGPATTLNQTVIRIKDMIADISGERDALQQAGRTVALRKFDERYGALLVQAMPAGLPTLSNEAFVKAVVTDETTGRIEPQWRQYLPAADTVAIYLRPRARLHQAELEQLTHRIQQVVAAAKGATKGAKVTVTGSPVVSVGLADQMWSEVLRLGSTAFLGVSIVLLLVPWARRRRRQVLPLAIMVTATAFTLGTFGWAGQPLSIGAAAFLPIILGLGSYYPVYLSRRGSVRVVLAVATASALAFAGLILSPLPFVKELGYATPLGLGMVIFLSLLAGWVRRPEEPAQPEDVHTAPPRRHSVPVGVLAALGIVAVGLSAAGWVALAHVPLKTDPEQLVAGVPELRGAIHVEGVLGYSAELDVRLIGTNVVTPAALTWSRQAENRIVTGLGDRVHPVVTTAGLLAFLGDKPTAGQIQSGVADLPAYVSSAVISADQREALASYGVAWGDLAADRNLVAKVRAALPPPPTGYRVEVSGLPVAAERGYHLIDHERYEGSTIALAAAAVALVLLLPRRTDAVLAVLAAAVASGLSIGLLALVLGSLNPLTLALGALTAAVGCEFTVLLLTAARRRDRSLRRSVLVAVLLSVVGYGALLTSSLPLVRELGLALVTSVVLSVLVALLVVALTLRVGERREAYRRRDGVDAGDEKQDSFGAAVEPERQEALVGDA